MEKSPKNQSSMIPELHVAKDSLPILSSFLINPQLEAPRNTQNTSLRMAIL